MNKNIRKVIAMALAVTAISAVSPISKINLLSKSAYASSDEYELTDIELEDSSEHDVDLYERSSYKNELDDDDDLKRTYYAKVSSGKSKIKVNTSGADNVRIFKNSSSKAYEEDETISINKGKTTLYINTYDDDKDEDDMERKHNYEKQYKVIIQRGSSHHDDDDDDDDDDNDSIYLDNIYLSDGDIDFSRKKTSYDVKVKSDVDEVRIKAEPEDEDYEVRIDGSEVDDSDKWRKTVDLDKGKNEIKIKVEDDDGNERTYKLNIKRGYSSSTSDKIYLDELMVGSTSLKLSEDVKEYNLKFSNSKVQITAEPKDSDYTVSIDGNTVDDDDDYQDIVELEDDEVKTIKVKVENDDDKEQVYTLNIGGSDTTASDYPSIGGKSSAGTTTNTSSRSIKANQWVYENGSRVYHDAIGNKLVNQWFYDKETASNYYLQSDGTIKTGWLMYNAKWYFLGSDGAMKTGWQYTGAKWYMFAGSGEMVTGWYRDFDGRWYFFRADGDMVSNTRISGYRLGSNGAWIR